MNIYTRNRNFINMPLYAGNGLTEPQYVLNASQRMMQLLVPQRTYYTKITFTTDDIVEISGRVRLLARNYFSTFINGTIKCNGETTGTIEMLKNDDLDSMIPWQFLIESERIRAKLIVKSCREHNGKCIISQHGRDILILYRRYFPVEHGFRRIGEIDNSAIKVNDTWLYYSFIPFFYFIVERFIPKGDTAEDYLNERI